MSFNLHTKSINQRMDCIHILRKLFGNGIEACTRSFLFLLKVFLSQICAAIDRVKCLSYS